MIKIIKNVVSDKLIEEIKDQVKVTNLHRSNYTTWETNIVKYSSVVLIYDLNKDITDKLKNEIRLKFNIECFNNFAAMYYKLSRMSYIPWHTDNIIQNDGFIKKGITVYMNNNWNEDWGGYFAYKELDEIKCIKPEYNTGVLVESPHTVFSTTIDAPIRETIQVFFT